MGLDIDFRSMSKIATDEKVKKVVFLEIPNKSPVFEIDYWDSKLVDQVELQYYRKWYEVRNTITDLFGQLNQCDRYIFNKEHVILIKERVEKATDWIKEEQRTEFLAFITQVISTFDFENEYFTFSWIS